MNNAAVSPNDRCAAIAISRSETTLSQFLLTSLLVAPLLIAVPLRKGWLRSLIPLLALLFLDRPVEACAGLAITLPTGSAEIAHEGFMIPIDGSRPPDAISLIIVADIRTSRQEQREYRQDIWRTHGGSPIGVFTLINRRHVAGIPMWSGIGALPKQ